MKKDLQGRFWWTILAIIVITYQCPSIPTYNIYRCIDLIKYKFGQSSKPLTIFSIKGRSQWDHSWFSDKKLHTMFFSLSLYDAKFFSQMTKILSWKKSAHFVTEPVFTFMYIFDKNDQIHVFTTDYNLFDLNFSSNHCMKYVILLYRRIWRQNYSSLLKIKWKNSSNPKCQNFLSKHHFHRQKKSWNHRRSKRYLKSVLTLRGEGRTSAKFQKWK